MNKFTRSMILLLALIVLAVGPAVAGLSEGHAAYRRGDYATAFEEYLAAAEQGDAKT